MESPDIDDYVICNDNLCMLHSPSILHRLGRRLDLRWRGLLHLQAVSMDGLIGVALTDEIEAC